MGVVLVFGRVGRAGAVVGGWEGEQLRRLQDSAPFLTVFSSKFAVRTLLDVFLVPSSLSSLPE